MKHILFLLLFLPVLAYAQFPANPNKIRLGNQTTADGLVVRTAAAPSWTPSTVNNAWLAFDTVAAVFYYYDAGTWNIFSSGGGIDSTQANNGLTMSGDTVQLGGALTKNTEIDINGKTFRFRDAAGYPDFFMNGTYGLLGSDANTYLDVGSTAGRARIVAATTAQLTSAANTDVSATDTVTISGQRIRMNAADTRIQQVANDNALNRLVALDSLTGQLKYVDKASISGGGGSGTVTGTGTTGTIPVWSSSSALGDSPLTVSSGSVIAGGTGFFRFPVGTTAQRPGTPTTGDARYSSTNGTLEYYGASAWENPVRSATATGLGTSTRIGVFDANGRLEGYDDFTRQTTGQIKMGTGNYTNGRLVVDAISGQTRIARFGQLEMVTDGNTSVTGQGFSIAGANRAFVHVTSNSNSVDAYTWQVGSTSVNTETYNRASGTMNLHQFLGGQVGPVGSSAAYANVRIYSLVSGQSTSPFRGLYIQKGGSGTQEYRAIDAPEGIVSFGGIVAVGSSTSPSRTLHVTGEARITDLTTDTPTQIVGADADGDLGAITVGSGLSLTSGTLSATGGAGTVTSVGITAPAAGITVSGSPVTSSGSMTLALADDLAAVEGLSANGIATRTASNTWAARTITGGSGIAITNGDGVSGNPTISRTYSLTQITISGGSTFFGTTPERPDNDTGGSVTVSTVGSDFGVSGSTLDYTGASGALLRVEGSVSFSVADGGDYYLSIFKEGTEIAATSTRVTCVAGNYYTIGLPATTTSGTTNDTFDVRIATVTGNSTTTMHRYGFIIERVY